MTGSTTDDARKRRGAWYTPPELIDVVVDGVLDGFGPADGDPVRVLDPAGGDGRFAIAARDRLRDSGYAVSITVCDIDADALAGVPDRDARLILADALAHDWRGERFDIVIGNPPFLSQMAATTTRRGSSRHGGGPYADAAAEFLALSCELARPDGGRIGLVLPQSILGARDAGPVRDRVGAMAELDWSWWEARQQHFDASVNVCAIGLRRPSSGTIPAASWTRVVTDRLGVPALPELLTDGTLGDRAELNANFRDEYYALVPAVSDEADGPPLVTSGLIDPGACHWGRRPVRFAKHDFAHPRVDLSKLTGRFPAWADRKLVPKVMIANQTRIIEAVADPDGRWLPGVPVTTATPTGGTGVWEIAAVLTAPIASVVAWHVGAGTGLSTTTVRLGPATLAETPWPAGSLHDAAAALSAGNLADCARAVCTAYGLGAAEIDPMLRWWTERLPVGAASL
jgi:hypothetical protein